MAPCGFSENAVVTWSEYGSDRVRGPVPRGLRGSGASSRPVACVVPRENNGS
jgi:hypothetical protein